LYALLFHECFMCCPSQPSWLTLDEVQIMKLISHFLSPLIPSSLVGPNILLSTLFSNTGPLFFP
jgi:hypothetical protein